jgi:glycosyltransferase involved in cell wall biosynthesis
MRPLKILTWHVHGSYLFYLSAIPHEIYLPVKNPREGCYAGRTHNYPWPDRVKEIAAQEVCEHDFDCILYQSAQNYQEGRFEILSEWQRNLPQIYLEHDPPRQHPTDTRHPVDDPNVVIVHVTDFNRLMWNCGPNPTRVIEHGVFTPRDVLYQGDLAKGIVVINNIKPRGRRLGYDIFEAARKKIALTYVGAGWEEVNGYGEVRHADLFAFQSHYRFFFNPIRYTSLGLAVCEAMMIGMPIVGLATTEMVTVVENGYSGYLATNLDTLIDKMHSLLRNPAEAHRLGEGARETARERFSIERFINDWCNLLNEVTDLRSSLFTAPIAKLSGG